MRSAYAAKIVKSTLEKHIEPEKVVASKTEHFLLNYVAPEFISLHGKTSVLFIYCLLTVISIYGCSQMKTYFSLDVYLTPEWPSYDYKFTVNNYMKQGVTPSTYVYIPDKNFYEERH